MEPEARRRRRPGHRRHRLHPPVLRADPPLRQNTYVTLGTDGFGRSTPAKLRRFFEVDRRWVTLAALKALADEGRIERDKVAAALVKYQRTRPSPTPCPSDRRSQTRANSSK